MRIRILDETDRRRGLGTQLLQAGIANIREHFAEIGRPLRRVYLFCDAAFHVRDMEHER